MDSAFNIESFILNYIPFENHQSQPLNFKVNSLQIAFAKISFLSKVTVSSKVAVNIPWDVGGNGQLKEKQSNISGTTLFLCRLRVGS